MRTNHLNRGFSLVETIFYLVFLVMILGLVMTLIVSISRTYNTIKATKNLESSAVFTMERLTREIRGATSVNEIQSALATSTGVLSLNTADSAGVPKTVKFYTNSSGGINIDSNGNYLGPLVLNGVRATQLNFRLSTTTNSQAIKISLTLESVSGSASTTQNFYSTVMLRGS